MTSDNSAFAMPSAKGAAIPTQDNPSNLGSLPSASPPTQPSNDGPAQTLLPAAFDSPVNPNANHSGSDSTGQDSTKLIDADGSSGSTANGESNSEESQNSILVPQKGNETLKAEDAFNLMDYLWYGPLVVALLALMALLRPIWRSFANRPFTNEVDTEKEVRGQFKVTERFETSPSSVGRASFDKSLDEFDEETKKDTSTKSMWEDAASHKKQIAPIDQENPTAIEESNSLAAGQVDESEEISDADDEVNFPREQFLAAEDSGAFSKSNSQPNPQPNSKPNFETSRFGNAIPLPAGPDPSVAPSINESKQFPEGKLPEDDFIVDEDDDDMMDDSTFDLDGDLDSTLGSAASDLELEAEIQATEMGDRERELGRTNFDAQESTNEPINSTIMAETIMSSPSDDEEAVMNLRDDDSDADMNLELEDDFDFGDSDPDFNLEDTESPAVENSPVAQTESNAASFAQTDSPHDAMDDSDDLDLMFDDEPEFGNAETSKPIAAASAADTLDAGDSFEENDDALTIDDASDDSVGASNDTPENELDSAELDFGDFEAESGIIEADELSFDEPDETHGATVSVDDEDLSFDGSGAGIKTPESVEDTADRFADGIGDAAGIGEPEASSADAVGNSVSGVSEAVADSIPDSVTGIAEAIVPSEAVGAVGDSIGEMTTSGKAIAAGAAVTGAGAAGSIFSRFFGWFKRKPTDIASDPIEGAINTATDGIDSVASGLDAGAERIDAITDAASDGVDGLKENVAGRVDEAFSGAEPADMNMEVGDVEIAAASANTLDVDDIGFDDDSSDNLLDEAPPTDQIPDVTSPESAAADDDFEFEDSGQDLLAEVIAEPANIDASFAQDAEPAFDLVAPKGTEEDESENEFDLSDHMNFEDEFPSAEAESSASSADTLREPSVDDEPLTIDASDDIVSFDESKATDSPTTNAAELENFSSMDTLRETIPSEAPTVESLPIEVSPTSADTLPDIASESMGAAASPASFMSADTLRDSDNVEDLGGSAISDPALAELSARINSLEKENNLLNKSLQEAQAESDQSVSALSQNEASLSEKQASLDETAAELEALKQELEVTKTTVETNSQQTADIETKFADETSKVQVLTNDVESLSQEKDQLTTELADANAKLAEAETQLGNVDSNEGIPTSSMLATGVAGLAAGAIAKSGSDKFPGRVDGDDAKKLAESDPVFFKRFERRLKKEYRKRKEAEKYLVEAEEQRGDIARALRKARQEIKQTNEGVAETVELQETTAKFQSQIEDVKSNLEDAQTGKAKLKTANEALQAEIENLKTNAESSLAKLSELEDEATEAASVKAKLAQSESANEELESLKQKLADAEKASATASQEITDLKSGLADAEKVQQELDTAKTKITEHGSAQENQAKEFEAAIRENETARAAAETASKKNKELEKKLDDFEHDAVEAETLKQKLADTDIIIAEQKKQLESSESELSAAQEKSAALEAEKNQLIAKTQGLENLKSKLSEAESSVANQQSKAAESSSAFAEVQSKLAVAESQLISADEKTKELESKVSEAESIAEKSQTDSTKITELENERNNLTDKFDAAESESRKLKSESATTLASLKQLKSDNESLAKLAEDSKANIDELKSLRSELEQANARAQQQLQGIESKANAGLTGMQASLAVATKAKDTLSIQLDQQNSKLDEQSQLLETQLKQLDQERGRFESERIELVAKVEAKAGTAEEIQQLTKKLKEQESQHAELVELVEVAEKHGDDAAEKLAQIQSTHQQDRQEFAQTKQQFTELSQTVEELKKDLQRERSEKEYTVRELEDQRRTVTRLQEEAPAAARQQKMFNESNAGVEQQLREELRDQEKRIMELESEHHDALEKLKLMSKTVASVESKIAENESQFKAKKSKTASKTSSKTTAKKATAKSKNSKFAQESDKDDLTKISGIGPVIQKKLYRIEVTTFEQIAGWSKKEAAEFDEKLAFKDRVGREEWVKQAKALVKEKARESKKK